MGRLSPKPDDRRIPSLDGLRAIAISTVVLGHVWSDHARGTGRAARYAAQLGSHGVTIFFVISGFLITRLLLADKERPGPFPFRSFYIRRGLRLWPALWVMIVVTAIVASTGAVTVSGGVVAGAFLFVTDYQNFGVDGVLHHVWSLAVEEQFYLIWPLLVAFVPRRTATWLFAIGLLIAPIVRLASWELLPNAHNISQYMFHTRYDSLATGSVLAYLLRYEPRTRQILDALARRGLSLVAVFAMIATTIVAAFGLGPVSGRAFMQVIGYSLENLSVAFLLCLSVLRHPERLG